MSQTILVIFYRSKSVANVSQNLTLIGILNSRTDKQRDKTNGIRWCILQKKIKLLMDRFSSFSLNVENK